MAFSYITILCANFLIFLSLLNFHTANGVLLLPCNVVWKWKFRAEPMPEDAVATHGTEHFIARYFTTYLGRVKNSTGIAYLSKDEEGPEKVTVKSLYQVLTNPNDCALSWQRTEQGGSIPPADQRFVVKSGDYIVTRVSNDGAEMGALLKDEFYYLAEDDLNVKKNTGGEKYLKSTINLRCEITSMEFNDIVEEGDVDFLGMDVIINDANTVVTQTVVHSKTFIEKYTFTESSSFSEVNTWDIGINIPTPFGSVGVDFQYEDREGTSQTETVSHSREKEVTSTRTVIVPPNTAVEVCSIVSIQDDFQMPYKAIGRYTIKGKTATEVRAILNEQGIKDLTITGTRDHYVLANFPGKLAVSLPTKTKFIIASPDDSNACKNIQAKIQQLKIAKRMRGLRGEQLTALRQEIQNMIYPFHKK